MDGQTYATKKPSREHLLRIGKAVEYMVASTLVMGTKGSVNASTAMVDDAGVDVTFFTRHGSVDVQIKTRTLEAKFVQKGKLRANIGLSTFRPRSDLYFLLVIADLNAIELGPFWLIPSEELAKRVKPNKSGDKLVVSIFTKDGSKDQWAQFRVTKEEMIWKIAEKASGG